MNALTPSELSKLVGILGRLGSDFEGERAAAGLLASRLLKSTGMTWADLMPSGPPSRQESLSKSSPAGNDLSTDLALCLRHLPTLNSWEQDFVLSLSSTWRRSPKQLAVLQRIAGTIRTRGRA